MPRGDGTGPREIGAGMGRGLGGCTARGVRPSGATDDRAAGFPQRGMDSGSGAQRRLTGRGKGIGTMVLDLLFSLFERVTRK